MSGESLPVAEFCKPAWRRRHHEHGDRNFPESRAGAETRAVPSAAASSGSMKPTAAWDGSKASLPLWYRQPELRVREGGLTSRPPSRRSPRKSQHSSSPAPADSRSRRATGGRQVRPDVALTSCNMLVVQSLPCRWKRDETQSPALPREWNSGARACQGGALDQAAFRPATSRAPVHCVDVTHVTKAHDGACARPSTQAFCPPCTVPLRSGLLERTRQRHSLVLEVTARHLEHHWRQQNQADQVGNRHQPVQRV